MSVAAEPVLGAFGVFPLGENTDDPALVIESAPLRRRPTPRTAHAMNATTT